MPSILNLKFKGNKSFVAFSNLNDTESLTKTWKVCTKVASYLEQGQRLENLSWRLWHLQNLMVDTDNAKSKREFKKLSKCMGDKLDKEKGRSIEELEAPDFKRNPSTEMIRQRAAEKERNREASQNARPGTIKRMQFTFSVDHPAPASNNQQVKKPDTKPSLDLGKRTRASARLQGESADMVIVRDSANDKDPPAKKEDGHSAHFQNQSLRFPPLFSSDFGPSALLYPSPSLTTSMNYGEALTPSNINDVFSIVRPTIELPLDELLHNVDTADADSPETHEYDPMSQQDILMKSVTTMLESDRRARHAMQMNDDTSGNDSDDEDSDADPEPVRVPPVSQTVKEVLPETVAPSKVNPLFANRSSTPTGRPSLTLRTQSGTSSRSAGPGATATSVNPAVLRNSNSNNGHNNNGNSAPGGVKAECSNCGATHTPLWRRGLNDELNCNACGLYCKLHKRPRPKSMRNTHGEGRAQVAPRQETVDVMAQCYNCHTTATPLWRKDDEGKTVCNACGLYYKLHGSARPISMKSDVIRKRSRHEVRRGGQGVEDTPSASPGVSRRPSPVREPSPTLAPDSTTQITYDYNEDMEYRSSQSELMGALGQDSGQTQLFQNAFQAQYPGPYHPDYLVQLYSMPSDPLPFSSVDSPETDAEMSPRTTKRRRMSTDSASEPPSSAVSYSSYNDGYSSASSATSMSQRSSMEFPFSNYPNVSRYGGNSNNRNGNIGSGSAGSNGNNNNCSASNGGPALRGSGNTFWHPPMMPQVDTSSDSPHLFHPPMLPPSNDESPMDYLHPPMVIQDDESLFSAYLHPPMAIPEDPSSGHGGGMQNSMYSNEYAGHDSYDSAMRAY